MTGARGMWLKAQQHNGRYLLPQRPPAALMKAAQWLIYNGFARWITSSFAPGIELTGKPWRR